MEFIRTIVTILLAIITAGAAQVADPSQVATASIRQVALGASMSPGDRDQATYDTFRTASGRAPALWSIWSDWGGSTSAFPDVAFLNHLRGHGTVPIIVWQPLEPANPQLSTYAYSKIANGEQDEYIRTFAQAAKAFGGRVLIRFAHEMEGYWFPWGMGRFDNTPTNFKAAWKHVWNIFRGTGGVGATNVRFVWSPNGCYSIHKLSQCRKVLHALYPGDKYVDYLGFSAFNWGGGDWIAMDKLYLPKVKGMAFVPTKKGMVAPDKPIIVTETGSAPKGTHAHPGTKADWIKVGYPAVYSAYPRIKAIVYFNVDMRSAGGRQADWRLTGSALTAYRNLLKKPKFRGSIH